MAIAQTLITVKTFNTKSTSFWDFQNVVYTNFLPSYSRFQFFKYKKTVQVFNV